MTARTMHVTEPAAAIVDVHNHLGRRFAGVWRAQDPDALIAMMDAAGVATIVNLDGEWTDELEANLDRYDRKYPGRFVTFAPGGLERHVDAWLGRPDGADTMKPREPW